MKATAVTGYTRKICNEADLATFAAASSDSEPNCIVCGVVPVGSAYDLHTRNVMFNQGGAFDFATGGRISFFGSSISRLGNTSLSPVFLNGRQGRWVQDSTDPLFEWPSVYDLPSSEVEYWEYDPAGDAGPAIMSAINSLQTLDANGDPDGSTTALGQRSNRYGVVFLRNDLYRTSIPIKPTDGVVLQGVHEVEIRAADGYSAAYLCEIPAGNRYDSPLPAPLAGDNKIKIVNITFNARHTCSAMQAYLGPGSEIHNVTLKNAEPYGLLLGEGSVGWSFDDLVIINDNSPFQPASSGFVAEGGVVGTGKNLNVNGYEFGINQNNVNEKLTGSTLSVWGGRIANTRLPLWLRFPKGSEFLGFHFKDDESNDTLVEVAFNTEANNLRVSGAVSDGFDRIAVEDDGTSTTRLYRLTTREDDGAFDDLDGNPNHWGVEFSMQNAYGPPSEHITSGLTPFLD